MSPKAPSYQGLRSSSPRASRAARGSSRKTDTRCEIALRSALWRAGCRFRKDVAALPGRPDIVFPTARVAVFCDGDFWHGRNWPERARRLRRGANADYWLAKIRRNMERDRLASEALRKAGWRILRFWESDLLRNPQRAVDQTLRALARRGFGPTSAGG